MRPEQRSKADSPIVVRRSGSVMLSEVQPRKARWPREVRPAGSVTEQVQHQLSAVGERKLCASELFAREYECFGYPLPPECAARR